VKYLFPLLSGIDDLLDKLRNAKSMAHLDLRYAYNQVRISNDGPQDDSIIVTAFQGLTPNGASCFITENVGYGIWSLERSYHGFSTYESCVGTLYK